jgi:hypothetical protein
MKLLRKLLENGLILRYNVFIYYQLDEMDDMDDMDDMDFFKNYVIIKEEYSDIGTVNKLRKYVRIFCGFAAKNQAFRSNSSTP